MEEDLLVVVFVSREIVEEIVVVQTDLVDEGIVPVAFAVEAEQGIVVAGTDVVVVVVGHVDTE
jgi:hypothetical protein